MKASKDTLKRLNGSTELKRLEEEHERLINQFLAEPRHLLTVMRWMPIGMIAADSSSRLILSNQQAQQIWRHNFVPANSIEEYQAYHGFHPDGTPCKPEERPLARSIMTGEVVTDEEIEERLERLSKEGSQRLWQNRANFHFLIQTGVAQGALAAVRRE